MAGMVIAVKGSEFQLFKDKQEVEDFARDAGAKVMKNLSKSVTHMVPPTIVVLHLHARMQVIANGAAPGFTKSGLVVVDESWLR